VTLASAPIQSTIDGLQIVNRHRILLYRGFWTVLRLYYRLADGWITCKLWIHASRFPILGCHVDQQ